MITQEFPGFSLKDKVALLTGAGRGIGFEIGKTFAAAGATVAIQDIDPSVAESAVDRIKKIGGRAMAFDGDVLDLTLPARLTGDVVKRLGGLHILVNNASVQSAGPWEDVPGREIERLLRANVVSPILFCQQAVPIFRAQHFGRIINIGSVQQAQVNPGMMAYSLGKGALEKFTQGIARTLAVDGITINQIAPGWTDTHRNRGDFPSPEEKARAGRERIPLGRIGEPADYSGVALLLASPAGDYITGQNIYVDGGLNLGSAIRTPTT
jgi:NAD(P)-dependent dehydrogenase (short-subunit alcohol dehydrogenase family)